MSIKKIALSFALAGIVGATGAVAENEGIFAGVYAGTRQAKVERQDTSAYGSLPKSTATATGTKFGLLAGYNQNLSAAEGKLGLRYYGALDIGDDTTNINANVDALYTVVKTEDVEVRGFAGVWLGYTNYDIGNSYIDSISGFDAGINVGVRGIMKENIGIELYGHFGFLGQDEEYEYTFIYTRYKAKITISQPYQIGARVTYTF